MGFSTNKTSASTFHAGKKSLDTCGWRALCTKASSALSLTIFLSLRFRTETVTLLAIDAALLCRVKVPAYGRGEQRAEVVSCWNTPVSGDGHKRHSTVL